MKAQVTTTITTTLDLDTFDTKHVVDINDEDGLSEVSSDLLGSVLLGALIATEKSVREAYPRVDRIEEQQEAVDIEEVSRSAVTGRFVSDAEAAANPDTTVTETI